MSELYGVCVQQVDRAGAVYQELTDKLDAYGVAVERVCQLREDWRSDVEFVYVRPETWSVDGDDWSVTVRRWR